MIELAAVGVAKDLVDGYVDLLHAQYLGEEVKSELEDLEEDLIDLAHECEEVFPDDDGVALLVYGYLGFVRQLTNKDRGEK